MYHFLNVVILLVVCLQRLQRLPCLHIATLSLVDVAQQNKCTSQPIRFADAFIDGSVQLLLRLFILPCLIQLLSTGALAASVSIESCAAAMESCMAMFVAMVCNSSLAF